MSYIKGFKTPIHNFCAILTTQIKYRHFLHDDKLAIIKVLLVLGILSYITNAKTWHFTLQILWKDIIKREHKLLNSPLGAKF